MKNKASLVIFIFLFFLISKVQAQTTVNSLEELVPYLSVDNANVKIAPGTYTITAADINDGTFGFLVPAVVPSYAQYAVFLFEGNNSTYDFTGVTINFKTEVLSSFGNTDAREIQIIGNNNVLLNLTMVDDGSVNDAPGRRATNIVMDGANNRVEGFHCTIKGSYPYGYGDIFGKGGGSTIGHSKHSACLVRGNSNHVKDCTFIHRSYGHCIFFQAANDPFIEGCYLEGELRTVGEVLAEEGTGSPADNVNFQTVWGYDLRDLEHDYSFSLQEDGIRAYNGGTTIVDGIEYERTVTNARVINNTIVKMRSGVTLGLGRGTQYVENCTALACESGFWVRDGNATIVNSRGDASVGPLYSEDAERSGVTVELTLLDNYVDKVGNAPSLYIAGSNHNFTLHDGTTSFNDEIEILISGQRFAHRFLEGSGEEPPNRNATNITFNNNTKYPIVLGSNASSNNIVSCGSVTNNGTGNTISNSTTCDGERPCDNTAANLQAECYDDMFGVAIQDVAAGNNEREVHDIHVGDWIGFNNVNLTSMTLISVVASGVKDDVSLEVRQGSPTGILLATIPISSTGSYSTYQEFSGSLNQALIGETDLYFVADAGVESETEVLFNLDKLSFSFYEDICGEQLVKNPFMIEAEDYCTMFGIEIENSSNNVNNIGYVQNGDWSMYKSYDLTSMNSVKASASSRGSGGNIEVRLGSITGTLIGTLSVGVTGNWNTWQTTQAEISKVIGVQDIYLVFTGAGGYLFNLDWISFENTLSIKDDFALGHINISPNPATDQIMITDALGTSLEVYNSIGALESKIIIAEDQQVFSLKQLSAGIYFLKFKNDQGTIVKKIIKRE